MSSFKWSKKMDLRSFWSHAGSSIFALILVLIIYPQFSFSKDPAERAAANRKYRAGRFVQLERLNSVQRPLIEKVVRSNNNGIPLLSVGESFVQASFSTFESDREPAFNTRPRIVAEALSPVMEANYQAWLNSHNDLGSSFLSITHALSRLAIVIGNKELWADNLLQDIDHIEGDRVMFFLDQNLFSRWLNSGAKYKLYQASGQIEEGRFNFNGGDAGGSLHSGFEIQGYTSVTKVPRIQINYRSKDGLADIDVDGYAPWLGGVIPNPRHMTYENSDVRAWYDSFVKKYGYPGFNVENLPQIQSTRNSDTLALDSRVQRPQQKNTAKIDQSENCMEQPKKGKKGRTSAECQSMRPTEKIQEFIAL